MARYNAPSMPRFGSPIVEKGTFGEDLGALGNLIQTLADLPIQQSERNKRLKVNKLYDNVLDDILTQVEKPREQRAVENYDFLPTDTIPNTPLMESIEQPDLRENIRAQPTTSEMGVKALRDLGIIKTPTRKTLEETLMEIEAKEVARLAREQALYPLKEGLERTKGDVRKDVNEPLMESREDIAEANRLNQALINSERLENARLLRSAIESGLNNRQTNQLENAQVLRSMIEEGLNARLGTTEAGKDYRFEEGEKGKTTRQSNDLRAKAERLQTQITSKMVELENKQDFELTKQDRELYNDLQLIEAKGIIDLSKIDKQTEGAMKRLEKKGVIDKDLLERKGELKEDEQYRQRDIDMGKIERTKQWDEMIAGKKAGYAKELEGVKQTGRKELQKEQIANQNKRAADTLDLGNKRLEETIRNNKERNALTREFKGRSANGKKVDKFYDDMLKLNKDVKDTVAKMRIGDIDKESARTFIEKNNNEIRRIKSELAGMGEPVDNIEEFELGEEPAGQGWYDWLTNQPPETRPIVVNKLPSQRKVTNKPTTTGRRWREVE